MRRLALAAVLLLVAGCGGEQTAAAGAPAQAGYDEAKAHLPQSDR